MTFPFFLFDSKTAIKSSYMVFKSKEQQIAFSQI